jgi:hypothetical protein
MSFSEILDPNGIITPIAINIDFCAKFVFGCFLRDCELSWVISTPTEVKIDGIDSIKGQD